MPSWSAMSRRGLTCNSNMVLQKCIEGRLSSVPSQGTDLFKTQLKTCIHLLYAFIYLFFFYRNVIIHFIHLAFHYNLWLHVIKSATTIISFLLNNFYCYSITVVCIFSPSLHPTSAKPTSLPHLHPPPWFCPCVLYSSSCNPLSPLPPPHSPLAIVTLFLISMSLVIFCLLFSFVDYVPVMLLKECQY